MNREQIERLANDWFNDVGEWTEDQVVSFALTYVEKADHLAREDCARIAELAGFKDVAHDIRATIAKS